MNWINQEEVDVDKHYGFIYLIEYTNGKKYIGKKDLYNTSNTKARLDEKPRKHHHHFFNKNIKRKRTKMEHQKWESDWLTYNGSSNLTKGFTIKKKTITRVCEKEIDLTYWEISHLMVVNALFDDTYMNQAIGRNFFSGKLTGSKEWIKEDKLDE